MSSRKKLTLGILIILTALLAGISIYVTLRLQESQAPGQTGAAPNSGFTNACGRGIGFSQTGSTCNAGCSGTNCSGTWVVRFTCSGKVNECGGGGASPIAESSGSSMGVTGQCGTTDQIDVFSKNCRASGGWSCGGGDLRDYIVYYNGDCTQTTPKYKCSNNSCVRDDANGTYTSSNCNNACTTTTQKKCGETCNTDADCKKPANGGTAVCRDEGGGVKKCANVFCPVGKTIPGANCDCNVNTRLCGQTCNASVGLCGQGQGTCRYIYGPSCQASNPGGFNTTYCVPTTDIPGLVHRKCVDRDQGNSYATYNGQNLTPELVQQLCLQTLQTTCYRCTAATNDANTCESQTVTGTSCPTGWTTNSNCAADATGGACPVLEPRIRCYRCTGSVTDGNMCEEQTVNGTSCPTGWTTNSNCAADATGGACPVETPTVSATASCVSNSNQIAISWNTITGNANNTSGHAYAVDISDTNNFANRSTRFFALGTNQTTAPTGFTVNGNPYNLDPAKNYYVRVAYLGIPNLYSNTATVTTLTCTEPTIKCYRCTSSITDGNMCEEQTVNGNACPSGWTTNSSCAADAPNGSCPVQVACGASCNETNNLCPQGHTCNAGICKLNTCLTPGNCSDNSCTPTVPVCGGSCTTNAQCPNNHSCNAGKCVLNGCTSSTCTNGCVPLCGGPCSTNSDCPNNHSCSAGKCILNGCTASTCTNGCTVIPQIPETGIEDDARLLIIGSLLIAGGYVSLKLSNRKNLLTGLFENVSATYEDKAERKLRKKAEK